MSGVAGRTLVLVRHSESAPRADRPPSTWSLTERGRALARATAPRIGAHGPVLCASSPEPKAAETAGVIADALGIEIRIVADLREHARDAAPFFEAPAAFRAAVLDMLSRPAEVVLGEESARQAESRFGAALEELMSSSTGSVAAITHGTVMALWLAPRLERPPARIWTELGWCGFAAVAWPSGAPREWFAGA